MNVLFLFFIHFAVNAFQRTSGLLIGVGKYDITGPVVKVNFMGYASLFQAGTGLHMRLYSRAFLVKSDASSRPILFINIDAGMVSQLLKSQVVRLLQEHFGADVFDHANVMISSTHTHSGPGGFFQYFIFDITSRGFSEDTFEAMTNGILESAILANQSLTSGRIYYSSGDLIDASVNRSPLSYLQNPPSERALYSSDVEQTMLLLKFVAADGRELGMLNWFAVHCTSMNNTNTLVSGDNKGLAALLFERWKNGATGGNFVAAFAQANEGDVSPNTKRAKCIDTGEPCDPLTSACSDGRVGKCIALGPGDNWDMFENTRLIGQRQFEKAKELYTLATRELMDENNSIVDFRHQFVDMTDFKVTYKSGDHQGPLTGRTCTPALGYSFAGGTTDGPGIADFTQGMLNGTLFWGLASSLLATPSKNMIECHAPKPILLPTGLMNFPRAWHPRIVETQVFRIGRLVIVGLPGEFTTMAGRRMIRALSEVLPEGSLVALAGLSNVYTHYIATYEEYQIQRYEGASTIFGPHTLQAYIQQFVSLTDAVIHNETLSPGPRPPFLLNRLFTLLLPPFYDTHPMSMEFGSIWKGPKDTYHQSDGVVEVSFVTGDPRNNLQTNATFLVVEREVDSGKWEVVYTDSDWETKFTWKRVLNFLQLPFYAAEIQWAITSPFNGCQSGIYRIRHFGTAKLLLNNMWDFQSVTKAFNVLC